MSGHPTRSDSATDVRQRNLSVVALAASEASLRIALDTMLEGVAINTAIRNTDGRIVDFRTDYTNAFIGRLSGIPPEVQIGGRLLEQLPAFRTNGLFEAYVRVVETGTPFESGPFHYVDPNGIGGPLDQIVEHRAAKLGDGYIVSVRDVTAHHRAELEMRRLATAIEQSFASIVITDAAGNIEYVNPAFEQTTGYSRAEVIGENPRILKSGAQDAVFYSAMWATLTAGRPFIADFTNRRKDGRLFQEESIISPIHDDHGAITSYVAVKRDVTQQRLTEATAERLARERTLIAGTIAGLVLGPTPGPTADLIVRQVVSLGDVATADLSYFTLSGPAMSLGFARADGGPAQLRRLPGQRSRTLRERTTAGPWVEAWVRRPWHPYNQLLEELGVRAVAHVPVRSSGRFVGLMNVTSGAVDGIDRLTEMLPALLEFAGLAGAILGPAIAELTEVNRGRDRIASIIRTRAFQAVFQPVVDIRSRRHVGYEALTRFTVGTAPDVVFAEARDVGLEAELELATLDASIRAAIELPRGAWLSLNVSPDLVARDKRLGRLLRTVDRPVVLEITEHVAVEDYAGLRAAIDRFRPRVRIAVDDAGSGVANLNHIVELRAAFMKLDISIVRGIESDLTRKALVLGLQHFAAEANTQTIAEGVETDNELAVLRDLRVPLVQGFLLARPAPAAEWAEQDDALTAAAAPAGPGTRRARTNVVRSRATLPSEMIEAARAEARARPKRGPDSDVVPTANAAPGTDVAPEESEDPRGTT